MKKNILIALSLTFSLIGFSEMKVESNKHKEECLGPKAKSPNYGTIYDALKMLINDKNCFISNIVVLPKDKKPNKALAAYRRDCQIKFGNLGPEVILQFEIDENKLNKDNSFLKKTGAFISQSVLQLQAETKEVKTEFKFKSGKSNSLKNSEDYLNGNEAEKDRGFRDLAVEAGVCKPKEAVFLDETNQANFAQSSSSEKANQEAKH
jgi:hypothetical protein